MSVRSIEREPSTGRTALGQAVVLLGVAIVLTAVSWTLRADRLPLRADLSLYDLELAVPLVEIPAALAWYEEGMHIFVDTRPADEAAASGLAVPGAVPVRPATFDDDLLDIFDFVGPDDPLVLYDDGGLAGANNIAARLLDRGFTDVSILAGGVRAWQAAGGDISVPAGDREGGS